MRKYLAALVLVATPVFAADVGVSVSIGQPGFYGQINIGNDYPRPALIYSQPIIIQQSAIAVQPLYLHVPRGQAKNWRKHCGAYNACGRPVYFVQENWYNNVYVPEYRNEHRDHEDRGDRGNRNDDGDRGHGKGKDKGKGH